MSRSEVELRDVIGVDTILWGTDYPHCEGTWPWTRESLQMTFAGIAPNEVQKMLGTNAVVCFGLDGPALAAIAKRIGPTWAEIDTPLEAVPDDAMDVQSTTLAFRQYGEFG
jgi:hypothetical protein